MENFFLKKTLYRSFFFSSIAIILTVIDVNSQLIPYFPIEISFSPCGVTNEIPGQPRRVSTISSLRIVLFKEPLAKKRVSSSIGFDGVFDVYHNISLARDYCPLYTNAVSRTMFFVNDIFTCGVELIGNVVSEIGIDQTNSMFNLFNYRGRVRPFAYIALTPDFLLQEVTTIGLSRYNRKTKVAGISSPITKDYDIFKIELDFIYFTPFRTRIFLSPYLFTNQYYELYISNNKTIPELPTLREEGIGCALGFRYSTPTWGFSEFACEYERNKDKISGANNYHKIKAYTRWENKFATERFGYSASVIWTSYLSDNKESPIGFDNSTNSTGELGQNEIIVNAIPIYNFNKFLSVRPEYEFTYRSFKKRPPYRRSIGRVSFYVNF